MGKVIMSGIVPQLTKPLAGILASDIAVGSTVKLMENGNPVEYLVVHKGLPSSAYDSSCDGVWVLRKDVLALAKWHGSLSDYEGSDANKYLENTFLPQLDLSVLSAIKQVKIPYRPGNGISTTVYTGSSGLTAKSFLLSHTEVGCTTDSAPVIGAKLDYFLSGNTDSQSATRRIAYLNGTAVYWWTRSPYSHADNPQGVICIGDSGYRYGVSTNNVYGIRPALILPSSALFDAKTLVLKGA